MSHGWGTIEDGEEDISMQESVGHIKGFGCYGHFKGGFEGNCFSRYIFVQGSSGIC